MVFFKLFGKSINVRKNVEILIGEVRADQKWRRNAIDAIVFYTRYFSFVFIREKTVQKESLLHLFSR